MARYFLECAYKGTRYSGFQVQENANTVQTEVEKAFSILHRQPVCLTGSSRTDAGVHALQNFFHFDYDDIIHSQFVYKMNAILPDDIVIKNLYQMPSAAHCRFDAVSREYVYKIHRFKNPFFKDLSFFYPFRLDLDLMQEAAAVIPRYSDFFAFSKTNTQVKTFQCSVYTSKCWSDGQQLHYTINANRFLRGMVRLLTATMLQVGRHRLTLEEFVNLFEQRKKCGFSIPSTGLYLKNVHYPENYFP